MTRDAANGGLRAAQESVQARAVCLTLVVALVLSLAPDAMAQTSSTGSVLGYPAKPVRLILPVAAGSTSDTLARMVARALGERLGQQVVADNHPGAGGNVGLPIAARAAPDGYTVLMISSAQAISPSLYAKLAYDLERDFAPVTQIAEGLYMLTVHPSVPAKSVKELVALARARTGQLSFGSAGVGTGTHLTGELLKAAAQIDLLHVPYRGMGPAIGELAGGQISLAFLGLPSGLPQMRAGKVRAIGVTSARRSTAVPDLPTLSEAGLPGFESTTWQGFVVPVGTSRDIVARLHAESVRAVQSADLRERFTALGVEPVGSTPDQFAGYIRAEITKWAQVVRGIGLAKQ